MLLNVSILIARFELFSSSDEVKIGPDLFLECQPDTDLMPEWYAIDEKQKQVVIYKFWQPLMPIYADSQKFRVDKNRIAISCNLINV